VDQDDDGRNYGDSDPHSGKDFTHGTRLQTEFFS
jgi:hypothetical protein